MCNPCLILKYDSYIADAALLSECRQLSQMASSVQEIPLLKNVNLEAAENEAFFLVLSLVTGLPSQ